MRLIDADVLMSKIRTTFCDECNNGIRCVACAISEVLSDIKDSPTVDTVKHGHWEPSLIKGILICSNCRQSSIREDEVYDFDYCTRCGAKMDKVTP